MSIILSTLICYWLLGQLLKIIIGNDFNHHPSVIIEEVKQGYTKDLYDIVHSHRGH